MGLLSVGVDHEHASLALRERVAIPEHAWPKVLRDLVSRRDIGAAVVVSTCLRTMVVADIERFHGALEEITAVLAEHAGMDVAELEGHVSVHFDRGAATNLFTVAAGLKSVVPGEFEILGQLRRAVELADEEHTLSPALRELFTRSLASGRRVRAETTIARGTTSFAHAAVETALEHLGTVPEHVVIVGAGQLGAGIAKSWLAATESTRVTILNRTAARVDALVAELADARVRGDELHRLPEVLGEADVVLVAVETPTPLVTADMVRGGHRPLLCVDLAVPHGVDRTVVTVAGVQRLDIEDLRARVDAALEGRAGAMAAARDIVEHDVDKFLDDLRARGASVMVAALREHFDALVSAELERRATELASLTPEQRAVVESLVRATVAKIAHRPTNALKDSAGTERGQRLAEATTTLFGLDA